jgi:hypothetical protein
MVGVEREHGACLGSHELPLVAVDSLVGLVKQPRDPAQRTFGWHSKRDDIGHGTAQGLHARSGGLTATTTAPTPRRPIQPLRSAIVATDVRD